MTRGTSHSRYSVNFYLTDPFKRHLRLWSKGSPAMLWAEEAYISFTGRENKNLGTHPAQHSEGLIPSVESEIARKLTYEEAITALVGCLGVKLATNDTGHKHQRTMADAIQTADEIMRNLYYNMYRLRVGNFSCHYHTSCCLILRGTTDSLRISEGLRTQPQAEKPLIEQRGQRTHLSSEFSGPSGRYLDVSSEYSRDIFKYLQDLETKSPKAGPYTGLRQLEWEKLACRLIEVHDSMKVPLEVLFLAVNIFHRFLSVETTCPNEIKLLGITAMWIATKYEESRPVDLLKILATWSGLHDKKLCPAQTNRGTYLRQEVVQAEITILRKLDYDLSTHVHPCDFLYYSAKTSNCNEECLNVGEYLAKISVVSNQLLGDSPSLIAESAMLLARTITGCVTWVCYTALGTKS